MTMREHTWDEDEGLKRTSTSTPTSTSVIQNQLKSSRRTTKLQFNAPPLIWPPPTNDPKGGLGPPKGVKWGEFDLSLTCSIWTKIKGKMWDAKQKNLNWIKK